MEVALIRVEGLDLHAEERRRKKMKRVVMRREKQTQNPKRNDVSVAMDTISADPHLHPSPGLLTSTPASS